MKKSILALILTIAVIMILQTAVAASQTKTINGVIYTVYDKVTDGTDSSYAAVTGNDGTISGEVNIQGEVDGCYVTSIDYRAFRACINMASVTIPDTVTLIGEEAFDYCKGLTSVTIPGSVSEIGQSAFYNSGLNEVTISAGVKTIGPNAFGACDHLTYVVVPSSVKDIGYSAFTDGGIKGIYFLGKAPSAYGTSTFNYSFPLDSTLYYNPSEVVKNNWINSVDYENEIWKGYKIKEWKIGDVNNNYDLEADDATNLARYLAGYDITINEFTADVDFDGEITPKDSMILARHLSNWDGYDKLPYCRADELLTYTSNDDGTCSVKFNYEKYNTYDSDSLEIDIPKISDKGDVVTSIAENGFCDCGAISSITIPNSVTSIGYSAFYGCTSMNSITIPKGITSIEAAAFAGCKGLTAIYVDNGNTKYHADGNCLIETSNKKLIAGCKNSTIPSDGSVKEIVGYAFYECTSLKNITIPAIVTKIGDYAFRDCTSLNTIRYNGTEAQWEKISKGKEWDSGMPSDYTICYEWEKKAIAAGKLLEFQSNGDKTCKVTGIGDALIVSDSVIIPKQSPAGDTVTSIGDDAFYNCTGLVSITIPESVTSIGLIVFYCCNNLSSISIPNSITSIGWGTFVNCTSLSSITIPNSVESIGEYAFYHCSSLCNITIPDSVTSIGEYAFYLCTKLNSIAIPDSVTSISDYTFSGCSSLSSITIPDSVKSIKSWAFSGCTGLNSITIPKGVTSIEIGAFAECEGLTAIYVESGNTKYHVDGNCLIERSTKKLISGCKNSIIPSDGSVTCIENEAFRGCTGLSSITIPDSVKSIGNLAFYNCTNLSTINYRGSEAEWNIISKITDWDFGMPEYTIVYNYKGE